MIGKEHVITLMNHKYDIDWLMAWTLAERLQMLGVNDVLFGEIRYFNNNDNDNNNNNNTGNL